MKKIHFIKATLFSVLFVVTFVLIGNILEPKWYLNKNSSDGTGYMDKMGKFYQSESDEYDVIFLGASHAVNSAVPIELYDKYGITSFNLGSASQYISTSYYLLEEAIRVKKIECVVLDIGSLVVKKDLISTDAPPKNYKILTNIKSPRIRLRALMECKPSDTELIYWIIPLLKFHDRWNELTENDFINITKSVDNYPSYLYGGLTITSSVSPWYGLQIRANTSVSIDNSYYYIGNYYSDVQEKEDREFEYEHTAYIDEDAVEYFVKIQALCALNNIRLVCVKFPTAASWSEGRHQVVEEFLSNRRIEFVDFNYGDYCLPIDWNTDTLDGGLHVNYYGAVKATDAMGAYLSNLGILEDHRNDEKYYEWDVALLEYEEDVWNKTASGSEKSYKWLDELLENTQDKVICIAVKDDVSAGYNEEYENRITGLGITEDLYDNYRCSYVALIDNGEVVYEKKGDEIIIYRDVISDSDGEKHKLEMYSAGMKQGNSCYIKIDDVNYQYGQKGFNVVVYDKTLNKVTDSVAIDTFEPGYFYSK